MIDLEQSPLTASTCSDTVYDKLHHIDTPQIISQESNVIDLEQSSSTTSTRLHSQIQSTPLLQPTTPATPMQPTQPMIHTPYTTSIQAAKIKEQSETNASIDSIVPDLCSKVNRKGALDQCLTQLSQTKTITKHVFVLFVIVL